MLPDENPSSSSGACNSHLWSLLAGINVKWISHFYIFDVAITTLLLKAVCGVVGDETPDKSDMRQYTQQRRMHSDLFYA
jgi:hypothetical protein